MKVKDLPIYSEYPDKNAEYEVEYQPPGAVQSKLIDVIRPVRSQVQKWYGCVQKSTEGSVSKFRSATSSVYEQIRDEPVLLARFGFITVCGLGGIVMGHHGGVFRKVMYTTVATSSATILCFPTASYKFGGRALDWSFDKARHLKDDYLKKK